jgi:hypothetical protein
MHFALEFMACIWGFVILQTKQGNYLWRPASKRPLCVPCPSSPVPSLCCLGGAEYQALSEWGEAPKTRLPPSSKLAVSALPCGLSQDWGQVTIHRTKTFRRLSCRKRKGQRIKSQKHCQMGSTGEEERKEIRRPEESRVWNTRDASVVEEE